MDFYKHYTALTPLITESKAATADLLACLAGRTGRKRRSTAGNSTSSYTKKLRASTMPTERSPGHRKSQGQGQAQEGAAARRTPKQATPGAAGDAEDDAFWTRMGNLLGGMESRLKQETTDVKDQLGQAIGDLGSRVEKTERRLDELTDEVHQIIDKKIASTLGALTRGDIQTESCNDPGLMSSTRSYAAAASSASIVSAKVGRSPRKSKEDNYWRCRRALCLRPIDEGEDIGAVRNFLLRHLGLGEDFLADLGPFTVQRIPSGPAAKIKKEAVVTFATVDARDAVRGAARNLAGKSSDYGVRLELPNHLKSAMSSLQSVAYDIRKKFPGSRTNVLFDDDAMDLVLDLCTREGGTWRRLSSAQAKGRKKKAGEGRQSLEAGEIEALLDDEEDPAP